MKLASGLLAASSLLGLRPLTALTAPIAPTARRVVRPAPASARATVSSRHFDGVLGTSLDLRFVTTSPRAADDAERVALAEIERLRRVLSSWDSTSELSQLFVRGTLAHPSVELVTVLRDYEQWNARSDHAYSARVGELSALWKAAALRGTTPDASALATAVHAIAQPAWRIDRVSGRVDALTTQRIDLNSLGKGFIIDHALRAVRLQVPGVQGAMINIGGDIHVWGTPPRGDAWRVAVANPESHADNATPLTTLTLQNRAVSSSGNYERGLTVGNRHYSHIFDPRTGQPVDHILGATVIASDNATANALATTLSVLSVERGMALIRSLPGVEALVVTSTGETVRSIGFSRFEDTAATSARETSSSTAPPVINAKLAIDATPSVPNRHQPYVAVWITDTTMKHIRTLVFWGDKPKYQREMSRWWGQNRSDMQLVDAVTRATRPAGKYSLDWDGLDQKGEPVAAGTYMFWLEVAFEDGAHSAKSVNIACGSSDASATIPTAAAFAGATISCERVKK